MAEATMFEAKTQLSELVRRRFVTRRNWPFSPKEGLPVTKCQSRLVTSLLAELMSASRFCKVSCLSLLCKALSSEPKLSLFLTVSTEGSTAVCPFKANFRKRIARTNSGLSYVAGCLQSE
jgi:hypothetical protein